MKIAENMYIVGSGQAGFMMSNKSDCHVYLIEDHAGHILIDAGVGIEDDRIIENVKKNTPNVPEDTNTQDFEDLKDEIQD